MASLSISRTLSIGKHLRRVLGSRWGRAGLALIILNEIRGMIVVGLVLWGWHGGL